MKRQQDDPRDAMYADEPGHSVNANVGAAIKLHKKLQRQVDAISRKENATPERHSGLIRSAATTVTGANSRRLRRRPFARNGERDGDRGDDGPLAITEYAASRQAAIRSLI
jgi:hypothetical protein